MPWSLLGFPGPLPSCWISLPIKLKHPGRCISKLLLYSPRLIDPSPGLRSPQKMDLPRSKGRQVGWGWGWTTRRGLAIAELPNFPPPSSQRGTFGNDRGFGPAVTVSAAVLCCPDAGRWAPTLCWASVLGHGQRKCHSVAGTRREPGFVLTQCWGKVPDWQLWRPEHSVHRKGTVAAHRCFPSRPLLETSQCSAITGAAPPVGSTAGRGDGGTGIFTTVISGPILSKCLSLICAMPPTAAITDRTATGKELPSGG